MKQTKFSNRPEKIQALGPITSPSQMPHSVMQQIFFSIRENGLCFLISSLSSLWLRKEMAVELRIGLLSFRNYELGNSRSLLARALITRNRTRHGRTRRNLVLSTLPTSLPSRVQLNL